MRTHIGTQWQSTAFMTVCLTFSLTRDELICKQPSQFYFSALLFFIRMKLNNFNKRSQFEQVF